MASCCIVIAVSFRACRLVFASSSRFHSLFEHDLFRQPETAFRDRAWCSLFDRLLGRVERGREALLLAVVAGALPEARATDPGRAVPPDQVALGILAEQVVE